MFALLHGQFHDNETDIIDRLGKSGDVLDHRLKDLSGSTVLHLPDALLETLGAVRRLVVAMFRQTVRVKKKDVSSAHELPSVDLVPLFESQGTCCLGIPVDDIKGRDHPQRRK